MKSYAPETLDLDEPTPEAMYELFEKHAWGDGLPLVTRGHPRETAERIDPTALTGSPLTVARKLAAAGAKVAATIATTGAAVSVWAVMPDGRRVRALYRRTATGWGSQGVVVNSRALGVTAALAELGAS